MSVDRCGVDVFAVAQEHDAVDLTRLESCILEGALDGRPRALGCSAHRRFSVVGFADAHDADSTGDALEIGRVAPIAVVPRRSTVGHTRSR